MGERVEDFEEISEDQTDFDFSDLESLNAEDDKPVDTDKPIEGDVQTSEDQLRLQARGIVGVIDMPFKFAGNEPFEKKTYDDGVENIYPALARLNMRIPALEILNAILWVGFRLGQSFRELKQRKRSKDQDKGGDNAIQEHRA